MLEGPDVSPAVAYLWQWHMELERVRDVSQAGLRPITYSEIKAWAELTDRHVLPHEVEALVLLDLAERFPGEEE